MSTNNLRPFLYTGPNSAISLILYDEQKMPKDLEVMLWQDTVVEMPEDHEAVQVLVHLGHLTPVEERESISPEAAVEVAEIEDAKIVILDEAAFHTPAEVTEVEPAKTTSKPKGKA